jgi:hypothetical protein
MQTNFLLMLRKRVDDLRNKTQIIASGRPTARFTVPAGPLGPAGPLTPAGTAPFNPAGPVTTPAGTAPFNPAASQAPLVGQTGTPGTTAGRLPTAGQQSPEAFAPGPTGPISHPTAADLHSDVAGILALIDEEINRKPTGAEYEAMARDTAPRPGESQQQTENRVKAQNWDNPLVARPSGTR